MKAFRSQCKLSKFSRDAISNTRAINTPNYIYLAACSCLWNLVIKNLDTICYDLVEKLYLCRSYFNQKIQKKRQHYFFSFWAYKLSSKFGFWFFRFLSTFGSYFKLFFLKFNVGFHFCFRVTHTLVFYRMETKSDFNWISRLAGNSQNSALSVLETRNITTLSKLFFDGCHSCHSCTYLVLLVSFIRSTWNTQRGTTWKPPGCSTCCHITHDWRHTTTAPSKPTIGRRRRQRVKNVENVHPRNLSKQDSKDQQVENNNQVCSQLKNSFCVFVDWDKRWKNPLTSQSKCGIHLSFSS